ncbi:MAG: hypothetical protein ACHQXA_08360, partial [Gemmatimonadales bacterium]
MTPPRLSPTRAIIYGGLTVGVLDMADAMIFFGLRGIRLTSIPQAIASGFLGKASFQGGLPTILLGFVIHFFVATSIVTVYYFASRRLPLLTRRPAFCGMVYGLGVYCFMNGVVIPLSAAASGWPSTPVLLNGLLGHALLIGLPSALFARAASA